MSGLLWKLNRLRAMNVREIAHRVVTQSALRAEGFAVARGWSPAPPEAVMPRLALFGDALTWLPAWQELYRLEHQALEDALTGKLGFFGHASMDVGMPVNWHRDPLTGIEAPLVFGKRLNYRDDRVVGNVKVLWELGRHQHLIPLAAAYAVTGEARYREAVVAQIEGWINANPFGLGIHWCSALELALRLDRKSVV